jgi:HEPN domain-containing protein
MPPEPPVAGSPKDWLKHARSDLTLAQIKPPQGVLLEALCFHAQQAAEKALKAILLFNGEAIPKTHSIRMLLDRVAYNIEVPESIQEAAILTDYAVIARYPGDMEAVDIDEYLSSLRLSEALVSWAEKIVRLSENT